MQNIQKLIQLNIKKKDIFPKTTDGQRTRGKMLTALDIREM